MPVDAAPDQFAPDELSVCLGHYDLGAIGSIRAFARGSPRAPKVIIEAERGKFLFKRRPRGDRPERIAFVHRLQLYLCERGFALPRLVLTRRHGSSMVIMDETVYELFEFVEGGDYDRSASATFAAGAALGEFHRLTRDFPGAEAVPACPGYHDGQAIRQGIVAAVAALAPGALRAGGAANGQTPANGARVTPDLAAQVDELDRHYCRCAAQVNALAGVAGPAGIVHGDWHPGNMLFDAGRVVAVMDYDSIRRAPLVLDVANGVLQFSILAAGDDPARWPSEVDWPRLREFLRGYRSTAGLDDAARTALPYLMCEAMIAEAVGPIAATGSFGRLAGLPFLQMITRKVRWLIEHAEPVVQATR